jgi:hypothetical protein
MTTGYAPTDVPHPYSGPSGGFVGDEFGSRSCRDSCAMTSLEHARELKILLMSHLATGRTGQLEDQDSMGLLRCKSGFATFVFALMR